MKILRPIGLLIWLTGYLSALQAQPINPLPAYATSPRPLPKWVVKFAPLSLLDPSSTIQFAVERAVSEQHSVQLEAGYGWQGMNLWHSSKYSPRYTSYEVWRGRAEWRYYWRRNVAPLGQYTALEGLYKQENAFENGTVGIGAETGLPQYYQLYSLPIVKHVWAINLKVGRQVSLSVNNRLTADIYGGLGIRHQSIRQPDRPTGFTYYQSNNFTINPFSLNRYSFLSVCYGIKFGYAF